MRDEGSCAIYFIATTTFPNPDHWQYILSISTEEWRCYSRGLYYCLLLRFIWICCLILFPISTPMPHCFYSVRFHCPFSLLFPTVQSKHLVAFYEHLLTFVHPFGELGRLAGGGEEGGRSSIKDWIKGNNQWMWAVRRGSRERMTNRWMRLRGLQDNSRLAKDRR